MKQAKAYFYTSNISLLRFEGNRHSGPRPEKKKVDKIANYLTQASAEKFEDFFHMNVYLRIIILERADRVKILKDALIYEERGNPEGIFGADKVRTNNLVGDQTKHRR